ncbi:INO80 complex subunit C-like [Gigantopelta aegis]|uniref:INO80 complex subunit C-like n=1 Tax=Gigantopelta aegis TaxID=1735272 RepID=UPI001B88D08D|nr:INO80 complex subunit C-like [Gigantopelta aegis]
MASSSGRIRKPSKRLSPDGGFITTPTKKRKHTVVAPVAAPQETTEVHHAPLVQEVSQAINLFPAPVPISTVPTNSATCTTVTEEVVPDRPLAVFKDVNYMMMKKEAVGSRKARVLKNLKQVITAERSLPWKPTDVTYSSIDAPPSFKPAKKYSDLSGLLAPYTDPQTKIRYATTEEFTRARMLPSDVIAGLLTLRRACLPIP